MSANRDEPMLCEPADEGRWAVRAAGQEPVTLTASEAAVVGKVTNRQISALARTGQIDAVKVDGQWLIDGASLAAYRERRPHRLLRGGKPKQRRLPAAPLLRQIELAGGVTALRSQRRDADLALVERAAREGSLTVWTADHLAVSLLGLTLWELWPEDVS